MQSARVVLAEEDPAFRRVLAERLGAEGYDVHVIDTPCRLGASTHDFDADLVVSSIGGDGPTPEWVRQRSNVLFIATLPGGAAILDALDAIDAGADDALIKPFSPLELLTRMRALFRRHPHAGALRPLVFDGLVVDTRARAVSVRGEPVQVPAREFDLLVFLASSPRQVFTRIQIMTRVWSTDDGFGTATVTEHVRRLRARIEEDPARPRWIQTVWSVGYQFTP